MKWLLILLVSALAVITGLVNIMGWSGGSSAWIISIALWVVSALILGRYAKAKFFMHGFWAGVIGAAINSLLSYFMYDTYVANNPDVAAKMAQMPESMNAQMMMLIGAPFGMAIAGVVLGLLTMATGKIFGEPEKPKAEEVPPTEPPPQA